MIPKGSLSIIADGLARNVFLEHCTLLDGTIEIELRKALKGERLSKVGMDRIVKRFAENMRASK